MSAHPYSAADIPKHGYIHGKNRRKVSPGRNGGRPAVKKQAARRNTFRRSYLQNHTEG